MTTGCRVRASDVPGRIQTVLVALVLCVATAPNGAQAQEQASGASPLVVFSVVSAWDGRPVQGAFIEFPALQRGILTDSRGRGTLRDVPSGKHEVSIRHLAFESKVEEVSIDVDQAVEFRIELAPSAIAVEPLTVQVTGRDPYLVDVGFYDRRSLVESGYFATIQEIESYTMFDTLFGFQRDLVVRHIHDSTVLFLNGLPAERFGYRGIQDFNDIPFRSVRGVEAYPCNEAPPEMMRWLPPDADLTICSIVVVWTS